MSVERRIAATVFPVGVYEGPCDLCSARATHVVVWSRGRPGKLCTTCVESVRRATLTSSSS